MEARIDDRILEVLSDARPHGEWDIALRIYDWVDSTRAKHGAWIRCIVQSLWRMENKGIVYHFWVSHGNGVAGDRMWFRSNE